MNNFISITCIECMEWYGTLYIYNALLPTIISILPAFDIVPDTESAGGNPASILVDVGADRPAHLASAHCQVSLNARGVLQHPSASVDLPLHRKITSSTVRMYLLCRALQFYNDLAACRCHLPAPNQRWVGLIFAAIIVCP